MTRKHWIIVAALVGATIVVATLAWLWLRPAAPDAAGPAGERRVLYWHDPMVPGYRSDKPGKSPFMDMDLVPVYADDGGSDTGVTIRPEVINNLGVRTVNVEPRALERELRADGFLMRGAGGGTRVVVDVFDRDADWLRPGLTAEVRPDALPGQGYAATVVRVEPDLDVGARSWRVTLRVTRPDTALKPSMSAKVTIRARAADKPVLAVPREAVIRTGTRSVVIRARAGGRFEPVAVRTGRELGEWTEILGGLTQGEQVVVSGQFLIDSEANLRAAFERLATPPAPEAP